MAEAHPFSPVKLICGLIFSRNDVLNRAEEILQRKWGRIDLESSLFDFNLTNYYEKQMGKGLKRKFISFQELISPEVLSEIKLFTNQLEERLRQEFGVEERIINLDPGYLSEAALIMATAKNFSHRIPLQKGIYAHLELLFGKREVKLLPWTYPDFKNPAYHNFLLEVRKKLLIQLT